MSAVCFNLDQSKILSSGNGLKQLLFFQRGHVQDFVIWEGVNPFPNDKL